jgi:hypothetical protein
MNPGRGYTRDTDSMEGYRVQYKNAHFSSKRIELDGNSFTNCRFKDCIIVLEKGDTSIPNCRFENCKLLLQGNAYTVGKIIKLFTGKSPLKVVDFDAPLFEKKATKVNRPGEGLSEKA